ncbi:carbonic anhydrase 2-like isoform X2 [Phymastichus coffea]|uniref:carbonic anhydrase 2-like isoform X2 n=1 Tax=Phymastichus coffea TaxID=108790 RepID=UPI00273CE688|nr:carbonic anhydrase 2-like isoform X2 [Phymastichus coffea]
MAFTWSSEKTRRRKDSPTTLRYRIRRPTRRQSTGKVASPKLARAPRKVKQWESGVTTTSARPVHSYVGRSDRERRSESFASHARIMRATPPLDLATFCRTPEHSASPLDVVSLFVCFHPAAAAASKGHIDFGYNGLHGPEHWAEDYDSCFGKHQSPINIEEHDVRDVELPTLRFDGLELARRLYMANNGHTAMLHSTADAGKALMSGGPLNGSYAFEQLHFHWGENDWEGSEDLINNHSFAMELHAVFYKDDYHSMGQALRHPDGLAVIAFFFEFDEDGNANPVFDLLVAGLPKIEKVGTEIELPESLRLERLLNPADGAKDRMQNYFTYNGSLTTPPCSEVVTWIDFKDPLYLSHAQLAAFRNISSSEGHKLTHNFRPVQPLSDRLVYHNLPRRLTGEKPSSDLRAPKKAEWQNSSARSLAVDVLSLLAALCFVVARHATLHT